MDVIGLGQYFEITYHNYCALSIGIAILVLKKRCKMFRFVKLFNHWGPRNDSRIIPIFTWKPNLPGIIIIRAHHFSRKGHPIF